jgi:hypothetical protein
VADGRPIAIGDLLADVEKLFGLTVPTTTTPPGLTLDNLNTSYTTGTGGFSPDPPTW